MASLPTHPRARAQSTGWLRGVVMVIGYEAAVPWSVIVWPDLPHLAHTWRPCVVVALDNDTQNNHQHFHKYDNSEQSDFPHAATFRLQAVTHEELLRYLACQGRVAQVDNCLYSSSDMSSEEMC